MLFDSRDSGLADGPKRTCIAGVIVFEVRALAGRICPLKPAGTGCNVSVRTCYPMLCASRPGERLIETRPLVVII